MADANPNKAHLIAFMKQPSSLVAVDEDGATKIQFLMPNRDAKSIARKMVGSDIAFAHTVGLLITPIPTKKLIQLIIFERNLSNCCATDQLAQFTPADDARKGLNLGGGDGRIDDEGKRHS